MLYKQEAIPVQASGFAETTHFDIPASGKAFKSLIDNIYSRKIEAPIRELSTNAWDAHAEAGIDEPFRMKLPSKFDLLFMVRDYGLGMSHDFIMGTGEYEGAGFKSLFASTKDQDNTQVGMKGLGSKSPFAYTDSFILRVFTGTYVRTYSTYLGENGIPQLAYQGAVASDERMGTAVQFPVQLKDIDAFYESAVRVLKGFKVLPEGLPKTVIDKLTDKYCTPNEQGSFWATYPKEFLGEGAFARQGCVIYPIDADKLDNAKWIATLGQTLVIDFPIGSVQMVDSREFLAYDEETIANINEMVTKIKAEIDTKIDAMLQCATTNWELRALFRNDMFSSLGPLARTSGRYNRVVAINSFMKEGLPRKKQYRNTSHMVFYSVVTRNGPAYTRNDDNWTEGSVENPVFVYVGTDTKTRRSMNKRAALLMDKDAGVTGVVMLEKLSVRTFRKLGKPKILRIDDLPQPPPAEKVARAPVVWDRFRHFKAGNSDYYNISEEGIEELRAEGNKVVYVFQNKGSNFLPGQTKEENQDLSRGELFLAHSLLSQFKDTKIVFINVRANEKLSRWPAKEFPRFDTNSTKDILRTLDRKAILPLINYINADRFEHTVYDEALDNIGEERIKAFRQRGINNPLFDLDRFAKRKATVTHSVSRLLDRIGSDGMGDIVDRALELGLEVLPEQLPCVRYWEKNRVFPYPLLRGKWERMAKLFGEKSNDKRDSAIFDLALGGMI